MRCDDCGYALWNLRERTCPECGVGFRPSDFTFTRRTVRFCCPHCDQAYHGQDAKGHPHPRSFCCVQCGESIDMDEMVLRPEAGVDENATHLGKMPWLERGGGGFGGVVAAWFRTMGLAMTNPVLLIRGVPTATGVWSALIFMAVTIAIFITVGIALPNLVMHGAMSTIGGGPGGLWFTLLMGVGQGALSWFATVVTAVVWLLVAHGFVRGLGGEAPLRRSLHCICYGSPASVVMAVPCGCISLAGTVWWIISATLMMGEAHRVSGSRAAVATVSSAVLSFVFVFVPLTFGLFLFAMFGLAGLPGLGPGLGPLATPSGMIRPVDEQVAFLRDGLVTAERDRGAMPTHIVELLDGPIGPDDFVTNDDFNPNLVVGGAQLRGLSFDFDGTARRRAIEQEMQDDPIAYRVGRFVFTHVGVRGGDPPELWLVVAMPASTTGFGRPTAEFVTAATLGGELVEFTLVDLAERVEEQNVVRRSVGLPDLPPALTPMPYVPPR